MSTTRFVMTTIVIVVAVYDLIVVSFSGNINASVSQWFASFAGYPAIVFGVGYLCGHFFGWMKPGMPMAKQAELRNIAGDIRVYANPPEAASKWYSQIMEIAGK